MLTEEKLIDLLVRRDGMLEQGRDPSPQEVCHDCPELLGEFKAQLRALEASDWMFDTGGEQALDTHRADARSDIYGLGCTLYFPLTGHPPYKAGTLVNAILAHRDQPIPCVDACRNDVAQAIVTAYRRMMAKRPEDRYQSMTEVIEALSGYGLVEEDRDEPIGVAASSLEAETVQARGTTQKSRHKKRRRLFAATTGAALLLAAVASIAYFTFETPRGQPVSHIASRKNGDGTPSAVAPFNPAEAMRYRQAAADHLGIPVEIKNSIGMRLSLILRGEFMMGSTDEEIAELRNNAQQQGVLGLDEAQSLPTEAEWEYVCRAGSTSPWHFGDDGSAADLYAWHSCVGSVSPMTVGRKLPNGFGVFDLCGYVREWCSDWHAEEYDDSCSPEDPHGPTTGAERVARGPSFHDHPRFFRSACHYKRRPIFHGFRPILDLYEHLDSTKKNDQTTL